jgi:hypothetical protein
MAIHDKNPATELKTDNYAAEKVVMVEDKEKHKRHDEWHKKDVALAAQLQKQWGKVVDHEHRNN